MSKILVCGSEGSLGQAIIPKLLDYGHQVWGVDNLIRHGNRSGAGQNYVFWLEDLCNRRNVELLFDDIKPDYVIQGAARIYGIGGFNLNCASILGEDITLHNNVLRSASLSGVKRIIYISSSMVYENCPQSIDLPVSEIMPDVYPAPLTEYGLSKFTGERLSKAFYKEYGLEYTIWRPFNIITPFEKSDEYVIGYSHVFADYIDNIIVNKISPLPIIGSGDQVRCFTWIDDVAKAIALYSTSRMTKNQIYNLGNQEPVTMKELAGKIHFIATNDFGLSLPELEFKTVGSYPNDVRIRIPDVEKAKVELGWEATVKLDESIKRCLKHTIEGLK